MNNPAIHVIHAGVDERCGFESRHFRVLNVRSGTMRGSDLTASNPRAISASPIARDCRWLCRFHTPASPARAAPIDPRRTSPGAPELLLDVPGLELGAAIQVEREARGDVERFQEKHDEGIRDQVWSAQRGRSLAEEQLMRIRSAAGGCEPEQERQDAGQQLGEGERLG